MGIYFTNNYLRFLIYVLWDKNALFLGYRSLLLFPFSTIVCILRDKNASFLGFGSLCFFLSLQKKNDRKLKEKKKST